MSLEIVKELEEKLSHLSEIQDLDEGISSLRARWLRTRDEYNKITTRLSKEGAYSQALIFSERAKQIDECIYQLNKLYKDEK